MVSLDAAADLEEVIKSLDPNQIPDKLHCPVCDNFLLNGYRLLCCEQSICESCYEKIADCCPMCDHRPFTREEQCKPNKALRNTAKAFLKTKEKKLADERKKALAAADSASASIVSTQEDGGAQADGADATPALVLAEPDVPAKGPTPVVGDVPMEDQLQPSVESSSQNPDLTTTAEGGARGTPGTDTARNGHGPVDVPKSAEGVAESSRDDEMQQNGDTDGPTHKDGSVDITGNTSGNMMTPAMMTMALNNNMDYSQMMQFMTANGMNGFNPIMGLPNMAMNPMSQSMYGGFGGPTAGMNGMNGMNMGMNFNPTQGMYGAGWNGPNNNMWNGAQNNNSNAFSNGIGGDFGSHAGYGYNPSPSGNFHQQQYPNGDFPPGYHGRGYGRGRARGRGGYGRGRGNLHQYAPANQQPAFQNAHEQQQFEIQNMQAQMMKDQPSQPNIDGQTNDRKGEQMNEADDDFAPGGQEEVQEALGADFKQHVTEDVAIVGNEESVDKPTVEHDTEPSGQTQERPEETAPGQQLFEKTVSEHDHSIPLPTSAETNPAGQMAQPPEDKPIPDAYREDLATSMPPPAAPLGPAAQYGEVKDFGFRGRGQGRYGSSRGRGSFSVSNGHVSPVQAVPPPSAKPVESKGPGVVGAPTGPKAMREPPPPLPPKERDSGGFQIMGRASRAPDTPISVNGPDERSTISRPESRPQSRSRRSHHDEEDADYDRDHDRKRRRHRHDDDNEMYDNGDRDRGRSATPEESRRSSRRSHRDKEGHSKHRSRRHRDEPNGNHDHEHETTDPPRDAIEPDPRAHKSSRSSKHDDRERERDRHRDRERDRDRSHKRTRHSRDDEHEADDDHESRHRSRRHKHTHREEPTTGTTNGTSRSHSRRESHAETPVLPEKDPHTLEREARNQERMLKEQQRREQAKQIEQKGDRRIKGSSSRRMSYKYEDEVRVREY